MRKARGMGFLLLLLINFNLFAGTSPSLESQRAGFIKAERLIKSQSWNEYDKIKPSLVSYPLYPYLEYEALVKKVNKSRSNPEHTVSYEQIEAFAKQYPTLPLLNRLLYKWLHVTAKQHQWKDFLKGYALRNQEFYATSMHCLNVYAQYKTTDDPSVLKSGLPLWLEGKSQPRSCNPLFKAMKRHQVLQTKHIVDRLYLATKNRHLKLSKYLVSLFPESDRQEALFWHALTSSPKKIKYPDSLARIKKAKYLDPMLEATFYRLARIDLNQAREEFESLKKQVTLPKELQANIHQDIAIRMAHEKDSQALNWLNQIPQQFLNQVAHEWLVRLSLMKGDWKQVIVHIDAMDKKERHDSSWRYWRGRALIHLGYPKQGQAELSTVSKERSYYGFLASEWLQKPYSLLDKPIQMKKESLKEFSLDPAIARVHEWMALERMVDARREWALHCFPLDEASKIKAAYYAHHQNWHDLAILTMTKTTYKDDLKLRFPFGFSKSIHKHAKLQNLDPAWVFALTRQESAFSQHVRSPVGATGLMQLMPKTAQYIAKKNQMPVPSVLDLVDPDRNVALGTTYLKYLSQGIGEHIVPITASYNAGINRVKTWLPAQPLESDIWIESIPFAETRDYVKNILAFMGIYKSLMGEPFRLSTVMLPVSIPSSNMNLE